MAERPAAALAVVSRDDGLRSAVTRELERRYAVDYPVVAAADPQTLQAELAVK